MLYCIDWFLLQEDIQYVRRQVTLYTPLENKLMEQSVRLLQRTEATVYAWIYTVCEFYHSLNFLKNIINMTFMMKEGLILDQING